VKTFIRAMKIVSVHLPQAEAWLIGPTEEDPTYVEECRSLMTDLGLENQVKFLGFQNPKDNSVIITDLEGRIEFVNHAFVRNSGYTREEVLDKTPNLINSGQTPPETFAAMWQSVRQGRIWTGEFINRAKDGRIYTDAVSVWPLRQPDGRITHYVAEQIDITQQKRERAELDSYRRGLEKLVEERTAALQVALHDLETSEENARRVMEWVSAIILMADAAGQLVYANPAGLLALGYSLDDLQDMQIADLVADCERPELHEHLAAMARGEHQIRSWTLRHKDGREIPFQLNTQQLPDGRYIAIGYDRSRELAAELQLRLAASVFENSCEGILITDAEGTIIDVNQAFVSLTGYSRDEAIGQNPRLLGSGRHDKAFFSAMRKSYREKGYWVGELWNRRKDGRVVRHMMTISAVLEAGQIARLIGLFTDVTEKAMADLRLQQSEERLRLTTEALGIGLWYWKPHDGVLEGNKRCWRLFGHDAGWRPGFKAILKAIHPKDRRQVGRELLQSTRSARTFTQEFRVLRPNGTVVWLSAMGTTYCNSLGPEIQMMGICMDISGRKSAEILLKAQHESLEASDRQKDAFIAMLSHEIRNPLAAINNAMAVLRRSAKQDPAVQWTEQTVAGQLQQLNRLVGDLLDVSRIAQGKLEFKRSRFAASELMRQALAISQPVIDRLGQRLHMHADIEGLYLEGDMARLIQVFDNLLQNAAKYTPTQGEIWVRAEAIEGEFVLSVRDSGIGIEAELLPRIFEPFVQGKHLPDHADSGMGIGLALAKRLVQLHGGSIHAESPGPGQGSTVTVHLPLAGQRTTPRRQPAVLTPAPAPTQESRSLQVLVVDDIPSVADSFGMLLELIGHQVRIANSGGEAVQQVQESRPDVVFLDIGLPDMTGFDAFRKIRELPGGADLPVVALTGFGQTQDLKRTAEAGFYGHLVKPADPDEVEALLRGLTGKL
jgi:PAS domain S-box-containing protein